MFWFFSENMFAFPIIPRHWVGTSIRDHSSYKVRSICLSHDDVIKWKHFPRYWSFVRGIHRTSVNSPHKGQWRGALGFFLICVWINGWVNNREAGDSRRYRAHYDVTVMLYTCSQYDGSQCRVSCMTTAIWRYRKTLSQWQCSFHRKLRSHWLKGLRQRQIAVVYRTVATEVTISSAIFLPQHRGIVSDQSQWCQSIWSMEWHPQLS